MSTSTSIEWTESTWSPATGCTKVSPGCEHCYIERQPPFYMARRRFDGPGIGASTGVLLHPERLGVPLKWRKPRRIFVCSMADLFHKDVPDTYIAQVWATMAAAPRHTFQVLTKRHDRMHSLLSDPEFPDFVETYVNQIGASPCDGVPVWPLPNVHLMVTAEDQKRAELRIPVLLETPAAVRGVSLEPLLGPIRLHKHWLHPVMRDPSPENNALGRRIGKANGVGFIDWVIVGGESGPKARPMHPKWAQSLRDQCTAAGVPFHFKQWGEWAPVPWKAPDGATHAFTGGLYQDDEGQWVENFMALGHNPMSIERDDTTPPGAQGMRRLGKKAAGRELDGRIWDEYPEVSGV